MEKDDFLAQYVPAATRLAAFYGHVRLEAIMSSPSAENSMVVRQHFLSNGECYRVDSTSESAPGESVGELTVTVSRPAFSFTIKRPASAERFSIVRLAPEHDSTGYSELRRRILNSSPLTASYGILESTITELLSQPDIHVSSIAETMRDDAKLIRLEWTRDPSSRLKQHGQIVFSPAQGWALREYSISYEEKRRDKEDWIKATLWGRCQYEGEIDGIPQLKRFETWVDGAGTRNALEVCEVVDCTQAEVPVTEFTLAHFGIVGVDSDKASPARWLYLLGFVMSLLALAISIFVRRRRTHV